jgi:hypothetical protein
MQSSKHLLSIFIVTALYITPFSEALAVEDSCTSVSAVEQVQRQIEESYCDSGAVNLERPDPDAEEGEEGWIPHFFVNPDECNLSLDFPDLLPDFGFDLDKLNSCQLIKAVSKNALDQVDEKFNEIENNVQGQYNDNGVNDNIDIDLNREVDLGINDNKK